VLAIAPLTLGLALPGSLAPVAPVVRRPEAAVVGREHRAPAGRPARCEEPLLEVVGQRLEQRRVTGAIALRVDVADRLVADVAPGEPADHLFGTGAAVCKRGDERGVTELEVRADLLDLGRQEDVRLARACVLRLRDRGRRVVLDDLLADSKGEDR